MSGMSAGNAWIVSKIPHSETLEDLTQYINYPSRFYDICEHFLGNIYFSIFKKEALTFSAEARTFISTMGGWYVGESFSYIIIWGRNIVHMFPNIVPDRLVIEEVSFHTITDCLQVTFRS